MPRLVIMGGGRMGEALAVGLAAAGRSPEVVEPSAARRRVLADSRPDLSVVAKVSGADEAVIAVKPPDVEDACRSAVAGGARRVLSIAAGVTLTRLGGHCGAGVVVLRGMPNTPALVGAGVAALAAGPDASETDLEWGEDVLGAVGQVVRLPEPLLDAVTGLSGSGPAYLFLVVEAMTDAGVAMGLTREVSQRLAVGTLVGSARLLEATGEAPEALRAGVTSPGGTTAAGLRALEDRAVRAAFMAAVAAATERSRQLGAG
ncbi:MAG TPA: pyrroline-5-carboxylate reductase [Acidimicrobiales bacterium]|nr:pyrroline-5-carboxylate reductase [Acidimicrobiales bacterium]